MLDGPTVHDLKAPKKERAFLCGKRQTDREREIERETAVSTAFLFSFESVFSRYVCMVPMRVLSLSLSLFVFSFLSFK